mgnify:CR=1 FL=1
MMILITYDVDTTTREGARRLRQVAKVCESCGVRVQNSTFELLADPARYVQIRQKIDAIIDKERDSVRFYQLGNNWNRRIETLGRSIGIQQGETLIL